MRSSNSSDVEFCDLTVRYPDREADALCAISERIGEGDVVAIAGPSGCGKTTLCRTLAGFIPGMIPARVSGDVLLGGTSVVRARSEHLSTRVGLVQQDPEAQICTLHVWQEVAFGPQNLCLPTHEVESRVERALDAMEIAHLRGRRTTALSGGEKQRVAVASILAMRPSVLLLDEPTANLDPRGVHSLFATLLQEPHARTLIIVEHRVDALRSLAPRLILLDRGRTVDRYPARERLDYASLGLRGGWSATQDARAFRPPWLEVQDVSFSYGAPLLRNLSLALYGGEVLGVIGPNGGGKTTLLRLLAELERPDSGAIERQAHLRTGFVFQEPHHQIFERTVRREMELEHPEPVADVDAELWAARLADLANAAPLSLSLGEQRRLTIATALTRRPNVLLLDEPFIGQDRRNVLWIVDAVRDVAAAGGAVVLVTHDIPLVNALCDRLLYLERNVAWIGSPRDVNHQLQEEGHDEFTPEAWR